MSKEIDIEYYHQLALQKQKEHRKFLGNLKTILQQIIHTGACKHGLYFPYAL